MNKLLVVLLILFVAAFAVAPAFAQGDVPPVESPSPPEPTNPSLADVAVLLAIVAFFKTQFGLDGKYTIFTSIGVGAALWFTPLIAAAFPAVGYWIDQTFSFAKWILAAMGTRDFLVNTGGKIATATRSSKGELKV